MIGLHSSLAGLLACLLAALPLLGSCTAQRVIARGDVTRPDDPARFVRFAEPRGQLVRGYSLADGRFQPFVGRAALKGETMEFRRPAGRTSTTFFRTDEETLRVALADLQSVRSVEAAPGRGFMWLSAVAMGAVLVGWVIVMNQPGTLPLTMRR